MYLIVRDDMILIAYEILEDEIIMTKYIKDHLKNNIEVQSTSLSYIIVWIRFQCSRQTCFETIVVKHYVRDIIFA